MKSRESVEVNFNQLFFFFFFPKRKANMFLQKKMSISGRQKQPLIRSVN